MALNKDKVDNMDNMGQPYKQQQLVARSTPGCPSCFCVRGVRTTSTVTLDASDFRCMPINELRLRLKRLRRRHGLRAKWAEKGAA